MELAGKRALVTGASSGLGYEIASLFLREGAQVIGVGRRAETELQHARYRYVSCDITDSEQAEQLPDACERWMGGLDLLVNCAGETAIGGIHDTSPEAFRAMFEVNVFGLYNVTRAALPLLEQASEAAIINVGSELGAKAIANRIGYSPAKAAVEMLTRCLAIECAPHIRVNGVLPGLMETPMTEARFSTAPDPDAARKAAAERYLLKRLCTVQDVAEAVLFLASPRSRFITGDMIAVCGGGQFTTAR